MFLTLHQDLGNKLVLAEAELFYKQFFGRLESYPDPLIKKLHIFTLPGNPRRDNLNLI